MEFLSDYPFYALVTVWARFGIGFSLPKTLKQERLPHQVLIDHEKLNVKRIKMLLCLGDTTGYKKNREGISKDIKGETDHLKTRNHIHGIGLSCVGCLSFSEWITRFRNVYPQLPIYDC